MSNLDVLKLYCVLRIFAKKEAEFWKSILNLGEPHGIIWIAVANQILELPKLDSQKKKKKNNFQN